MAYLDATTRLGLYGGSRSSVAFTARDPSGFIPVVSSSKGGRRRKRRRYVVEIDGQFFDADNITAVQSALAIARDNADEAAARDVRTEVAQKPPRIKVLTTTGKATTSQIIQRAVRTTQKAINKAYTNAAKRIARDNEIAQLLHVKFAEEDEEDSILALLLS